MRLVASLAAAGALLCGAAPVAAVDAPSGGLGLRLLDVPADTRYIVATVPAGGELRRRVEISNTTPQPLEVQLYVAAASAAGPAGFDFAEGRTPNELSRWTAVRPSTVQVGPGGRAVADVEVSVPDDAAPGERLAVVWAEQGSGSGGVTLLSRVGVRMYVEVVPTGPADGLEPAVLVATGLVLLAAAAGVWSVVVQRANPPA